MQLFRTHKDSLSRVFIQLRWYRQLGPQATCDLISSLQEITALENLTLNHLDLRSESTRSALGGALRKWSHSLQNLHISYCIIDAQLIMDGISPNPRSILAGDQLSSRNNSSLRFLSLVRLNLEKPHLLLLAETIKQHPHLRLLCLSGNDHLFVNHNYDDTTDRRVYHDPFLKALGASHQLRTLDLEDCGIDHVTATHLFQQIEHMPYLQELHLSLNPGFTIGGPWMESLPLITGLEYLRISRPLVNGYLRPALSSSALEVADRTLCQNTSITYFIVSTEYFESLHKWQSRNEHFRQAKELLSPSSLSKPSRSLWPTMLRKWQRTGYYQIDCSVPYLFLRTTCDEWVAAGIRHTVSDTNP